MHFATGGATDHVFALCQLLGFRFAPCLRDIADRKLGSIAVPSTYKRIESPMGCTIKTAAGWPPTSGKTGWILPHTPRERTTMLASSEISHAIWLRNRPAVRCSTSRKVAVQQKRSQIACL